MFVGVIVFSYSSTPPVEKEEVVLIREIEDTLDISGDFEKDEKLLVFFHAPRWGYYPIPDPTAAIVYVDVFDPFDNKTEFGIQFNKNSNPELWLRSNNTGGLEVSLPLEGIVGVTKYAGEYRAHIHEKSTRYYNFSPPPVLQIFKVDVYIDYPYRAYLPLGAGFVVIGVVVSVWGARTRDSEKKTVRKRITR
jgi:hypothetical protein